MADKEEAIEKLTKISNVGEKRAENLYENGFESPEEIVERGLGGLAEVSQIGFQNAKKILDNSKEVVEKGENAGGTEEGEDLVGEMEKLEKTLSEGTEEEGAEEEEEEKKDDDVDDLMGEMKELEESLAEEGEEEVQEEGAEEEEETEEVPEEEVTEEEKTEEEEGEETEEVPEEEVTEEEKTEEEEIDQEAEMETDTSGGVEEMKDEVEAIEGLQEDIEEVSQDATSTAPAEQEVEPEGVEEDESTDIYTDKGEVEDELGGLLETIGGAGEEGAEPDLEVAQEIDEWIEDTVGIEAHVGEESKCPICGEIVSVYQDRCDRCGVEFVEGGSECEECGASVDPEAVRCQECGAALVDEKTKCPICESIIYASEDICPNCGTEFYEEKIRCDGCKSTVPMDAIICPNCDTILRQKIMEEHMSDKMEVTSEKTEVDIGGMNIQMQGAPETPSGRAEGGTDFGGNHTTASGRVLFPFPAIVDQEEMKRALLLNAVNQDIGGVLIEGQRGTAKSVAVRGLSEILPDIEVIEDCRFSCDPKDRREWCWECEEKYGDVPYEEIPVEERPVKVIDLPLNATEDRVVGTLDVEKMMQEGVKAFQEGILAEVNRGILYVDEINLLDDFIVDVLLDAAAMGRVTVEREDISVTYPSNFILVGSMNPEEGALRPQLLDRLALNVKVEGIPDSEERKKIIKRREEFNEEPEGFRESWDEEVDELRENVITARERIEEVTLPERIDDIITKVSVDFEVDGHRADIIMKRAARTNAAFEGRAEVNRDDVTMAAKMALPHRMKKGPLEEQEFSVERLKRLVRQYS
ncbi:MAG: zinc ribbon domain-containing protein [Candidatus Thermoplasmatota archaeon]|nr:zinc ribbon domain-containing protein [Candidatus Thermoplasmatota archaeon]